jgi:transposase InsO family protein
LAAQKVFADQEALILSLRRERRLGVKQLRNELIRQHDLTLSLDTIHRTLVRNGEQVLKRPRRWRKGTRRYSRPIPGDRVQMDVCKIRPGVYQYTAIDDCSRYKVLGVYSRATAANTLDFLERLIEEMPFPIQRIQTDRGREFFAEAVQQRLMDWAIKFRPIPPRSPHLNGKVERTHRADREEFWDTVDAKDPEIEAKLAEWQHHWNWHRPHTALGGMSPIDRVCELLDKTPLGEAVEAAYDGSRERIRIADYRLDTALAQLK